MKVPLLNQVSSNFKVLKGSKDVKPPRIQVQKRYSVSFQMMNSNMNTKGQLALMKDSWFKERLEKEQAVKSN